MQNLEMDLGEMFLKMAKILGIKSFRVVLSKKTKNKNLCFNTEEIRCFLLPVYDLQKSDFNLIDFEKVLSSLVELETKSGNEDFNIDQLHPSVDDYNFGISSVVSGEGFYKHLFVMSFKEKGVPPEDLLCRAHEVVCKLGQPSGFFVKDKQTLQFYGISLLTQKTFEKIMDLASPFSITQEGYATIQRNRGFGVLNIGSENMEVLEAFGNVFERRDRILVKN